MWCVLICLFRAAFRGSLRLGRLGAVTLVEGGEYVEIKGKGGAAARRWPSRRRGAAACPSAPASRRPGRAGLHPNAHERAGGETLTHNAPQTEHSDVRGSSGQKDGKKRRPNGVKAR